MDTELARTFLAVIAAGNFAAASERLHVTPSTVSTRIHTLETLLGCRLFVRNKAGATLTPAGRQFRKHASILVRTVEQARQDVGIPRGFRASVAVGGRFGLWDQLLLHWLPLIRERMPDVSVRAEIGFEADLMHGLLEGGLDLAVMYTPQSRPGLRIEDLLEERLVLVSTEPAAAPAPGAGYVYVDWGPEFYAKHSASFPDFAGPALTANIGWLALQHILTVGGSAYLPERQVGGLIAEGRLARVDGAPAFRLPAYLVYPIEAATPALDEAVATIREVAAAACAAPGRVDGRNTEGGGRTVR